MKKGLIILNICIMASMASCKQTMKQQAAAIETQSELPIASDSTLIRINQIIAEEFAARNLEYTVEEEEDWNKYLKYTLKGSNSTTLLLTIQTFDSEQSVKQEIIEMQETRKENKYNEEFMKIQVRYLRINNELYSFYGETNSRLSDLISQIEYKIYTRIIQEMQIKEEDTGIW